MRALAIRLRSTSRVPWKALKKTEKKTSTTASATLPVIAEAEPDDEHRRRARCAGWSWRALMNGAITSASTRIRPSAMPQHHAGAGADEEAEDGLLAW